MKAARPFVKMAGGKTSSLPFLLQHLPGKIDRYFEPMVGGGALFFQLARENRFKSAWINDANQELINAYLTIQQESSRLIGRLKKMKNSEREFYGWRARQPKDLDELQRAARFIYLNKTGFNGLHRVNRKGEFNVPFGHYSGPTICDEPNLRACSEVLQGVEITCSDYQAMPRLRSKDVMYLDPPYVPVSETANFIAYTSSGFDHQRLSDWIRQPRGTGTILLSNSDTPVTRELYRGFRIHETDVKRSINRDRAGRGKVGEILLVVDGKKSSKKSRAA